MAYPAIAAPDYHGALAKLPRDAKWSCSFGYPGQECFAEFYRDTFGHRYEINKRPDGSFTTRKIAA